MNIFQFAEFYNLQLMNVNVDTQVAKAVFINLTLNVIYYEIQHLLTLKERGGGANALQSYINVNSFIS